MRVFDAHHHLWDPAQRQYPWMTDAIAPIRKAFTLDDLRAALPAEVERTIVVQAVASIYETEELLRFASCTDRLIAGVVGWVDLTGDCVAVEIMRLRRAQGGMHLMGVRHQVHDEDDPRWLTREDVQQGLTAVADAGLTYDLLVRSRELPAACAAVQRVPHLQFIVDHGAKPQISKHKWEPWSTGLAALAAFPNVACKLSGLVTEADWRNWDTDEITTYIRRLLELFGPERLIFGSDWPVCLLAASYEEVLDLARSALSDLTASELDAVFYENAQRIYGLCHGEVSRGR